MTDLNPEDRALIELKPCPFCQDGGDLAFTQPCTDGGWGVTCRKCHTNMDVRVTSKAVAASYWNARAEGRRSPGEGGEAVKRVAAYLKAREFMGVGGTFVDDQECGSSDGDPVAELHTHDLEALLTVCGWDEPKIVSEHCETCGGSGQVEGFADPRTYQDLSDEDAAGLATHPEAKGGVS